MNLAELLDQAPLDEAVKHANPHHYIIGAQSSLAVDAGGNPWKANGFIITEI